MRLPVDKPYRITLRFGATSPPYSKNNPHNGTDIVSTNKKIRATQDCTITYAANTKGKSGWMIVEQGKYRISHSHCVANSFRVKVGQRVKEGTWIATMGKTGFASGVHDHAVVNGGTIDLENLIKEEDMYKGKTAKQHYDEKAIWAKKAKSRAELAEKLKKQRDQARKERDYFIRRTNSLAGVSIQLSDLRTEFTELNDRYEELKNHTIQPKPVRHERVVVKPNFKGVLDWLKSLFGK